MKKEMTGEPPKMYSGPSPSECIELLKSHRARLDQVIQEMLKLYLSENGRLENGNPLSGGENRRPRLVVCRPGTSSR